MVVGFKEKGKRFFEKKIWTDEYIVDYPKGVVVPIVVVVIVPITIGV